MATQIPYYKIFGQEYPDEDSCFSKVFKIKQLQGFKCGKCVTNNPPAFDKKRKTTFCGTCGKETTLLDGTIFKNSNSLYSWFKMLWYWSYAKKLFAAGEMGNAISLSRNSTNNRLQKLRKVLAPSYEDMLTGNVTIDCFAIGRDRLKFNLQNAVNGFVILAVSPQKGGHNKIRVKSQDKLDSRALSEFKLQAFSSSSVVEESPRFSDWDQTQRSLDKEYFLSASPDLTKKVFTELNKWIIGTYRGTICSSSSLQNFLDEYCFWNNYRVKRGEIRRRVLFEEVLIRAVTHRQP